MPNLLNRLISNEVGTSAFLATLLDPHYNHSIFVEARAATADVLLKHGLPLAPAGPTHVELEYSNIDIVAVWSGWTILVENKIAAASVTRGQLSDYYSASLIALERREFLKHVGEEICQHPLCFVYLTPTRGTGAIEFDGLALATGRSDKKIHIGWDELLERFMPLVGRGNDYPSGFFDAGMERIQGVLTAAKRGRLPEDEHRQHIQVLMNELRERLQSSSVFGDLTCSRWSDRFKEQLFATGPERPGYVGLYISCDGTSFPSAHTIRAVGQISFDVASKHRGRLRGFLASKTLDEWATSSGLPSDSLEVNVERGALSWRFALPEASTDEFLTDMVKRLEHFCRAFLPILTESGVTSPVQPSVAPDAPQATRR